MQHFESRLADTEPELRKVNTQLSGLCLCKGEGKMGPGWPGPPILNIWVIIVGG
jgi:hypothetical protein